MDCLGDGASRPHGGFDRSFSGPGAARLLHESVFNSAIAELLGTAVCDNGEFASSISISLRPLGDAASSRARPRRLISIVRASDNRI
jgi:hypothetical protein